MSEQGAGALVLSGGQLAGAPWHALVHAKSHTQGMAAVRHVPQCCAVTSHPEALMTTPSGPACGA
jgi:hypothetical protein